MFLEVLACDGWLLKARRSGGINPCAFCCKFCRVMIAPQRAHLKHLGKLSVGVFLDKDSGEHGKDQRHIPAKVC